jgi:hypothetical protein
MIRRRDIPSRQLHQLERAVAGASLVGWLTSLILVVVGLAIGGSVRSYFLLFAAMMPFLILQALWRALCFAMRAPRRAALCDGIWLVVQGSLYAIMLLLGLRSGLWFAAGWGVGAAAGGIAFSWRRGVWPSPRSLRSHLVAYRDLIPNLVGEFGAAAGVSQSVPYALTTVMDLEAIAAIRAGQVELGLLNIPLQGLGPLAMAYAVQAYARGRHELQRLLRACAVGGGVLIVGYGFAVSILPVALMHHLVGPNAPSARPLVIPLTLMLLGQWLSFVAFMGLRARADVRITFVLQGCISVVLVTVALVGGAEWKAAGACWGMAFVNLVGSAVAWQFHVHRMRIAHTSSMESPSADPPRKMGDEPWLSLRQAPNLDAARLDL